MPFQPQIKIAYQLFKEFGIPLLFSEIWIYAEKEPNWSWHDYFGNFGASFFFFSWGFSQWNRVRKQQKVESELSSIGGQVRQMLNDLDVKTRNLISYITGGDSFCHISGSIVTPTTFGSILVIHKGLHPLYNVMARVFYVEQRTYTNINFGDLIQGHCFPNPQTIPIVEGNTQSFNIFFTARNGSFVQQLRFRKVNGSWQIATRVDKETIVFEQISESFPKNADDEVEWDLKLPFRRP